MSGRSIPAKDTTAKSAGGISVNNFPEPASPSNLGAGPNQPIKLGVIVEDSQGAQPDAPERNLKNHGMMKRLTTEEWNEQKDLITMTKPKRLIHQESIDAIPVMTPPKKENIKGRIFENDDITRAEANQMSRKATRYMQKAKWQNDRANSMINHFKDDVNDFSSRINARLAYVKTVPKAPFLRTEERSR